MNDSRYVFTREQLLELMDECYLEGYHCGWRGDDGAAEHLDYCIKEGRVSPPRDVLFTDECSGEGYHYVVVDGR